MDRRTFNRFTSKFTVGDDCWLWEAGTNKHGYGLFNIKGKSRLAHRVSFQLLKGALIGGMVLDHTCNTPACVNPKHLDQVTQSENIKRGNWSKNSSIVRRAKRYCKRDHPLFGDNLYEYKGHRLCKICRREAVRKMRNNFPTN